MFAKFTITACLIGLAYSGALQSQGWNLSQYGNLGTYGRNIPSTYGTGFGYSGYGQNYGAYNNQANYGGAISHVSIVKEISTPRVSYNGAGVPYSDVINPYAGTNSLSYAGISNSGVTGWPNGNSGLSYAGNIGHNLRGNLHYNGASGYAGVNAYYGGASAYPNVGVATSYSNFNRGFVGHGLSSYSRKGYDAYGNQQAW